MTTTYDINQEDEALAVIGKLAIDMYKVDPFYWERHYPVALVNVVQDFLKAKATAEYDPTCPYVVVHEESAKVMGRFPSEELAVCYIGTLDDHKDGIYGIDRVTS